MKKLALILAMLLVVPAAAFGLEMMDNTALESVTGQSGVAIVFDDIEMFINIDKMGYVDTDGFSSTEFLGTNNSTTSTNGGAISITDFQLDTLVINAIVTGSFGGTTWDLASSSAGTIDLQYDYASTAALNTSGLNDLGTYYADGRLAGLENYHAWNILNAGGYTAKALTIDVTADLPVTSEAMTANTNGALGDIHVGGVLISMPTIELYLRDFVLTPRFNDLLFTGTATDYTFNNGASYGTFVIEGMTVALLNGWLEISPLGHE